jgi:hypothetical protein
VASINDPAASVALIEKLPKVNKRVVCYLVRFLQIVLDPANQVKTKMPVNNIAMVIPSMHYFLIATRCLLLISFVAQQLTHKRYWNNLKQNKSL